MPSLDITKPRSRSLEYYYRNREKVLSCEKRKEVLRLAHKRRYADPEYRLKLLKKNAAWAKANPDKVHERITRYRLKNLPAYRARYKAWKKKNPERVRYWENMRRAQKASASVNPVSIYRFTKSIRRKRVVPCYYCGNPIPGKKVHFDHIIPLSRGGSHSVENLCVSCPKCNHAKHTKMVHEWLKLGQQILSL